MTSQVIGKVMLNLAVMSVALLGVSTANAMCRCLPSQSCWLSQKAWQMLSKQLSTPLVKPKSPVVACQKEAKNAACTQALKRIRNPFYLQSKPGYTESYGWWKAWTYHNSEYAVEAKNTQDVVVAVNFARKHRIKLVIKGAGHDYLGRSNAPNSLLIWTHYLQKLDYHKKFVSAGAPKNIHTVTALTMGAGVVWFQAYHQPALG